MVKYQRIRDLREDADMTQKQAAEKLYLHLTQYRRYESGESELPMNIAMNIADLYSVSLDYLAGRTLHRAAQNHDYSEDEVRLVDMFRTLSERRKGKLELYAEMLNREEASSLSAKGAI
ncbi:MAG: helix-turn-helix domain-containing protein [Oscillospiraceae bacterium]|nr:helix-turn-helix domain-containing protein [Oscillospiraceae bacterium]